MSFKAHAFVFLGLGACFGRVFALACEFSGPFESVELDGAELEADRSSTAVYSNSTSISSTPTSTTLLTLSGGTGTDTADYILAGLERTSSVSGSTISTVAATLNSSTAGLELPTVVSTTAGLNSSTTTAIWSTGTIHSVSQRLTAPVRWSSSMPEVEKCWSDIVHWRSSSISYWNANAAGRTVVGTLTSSLSFTTITTTTLTTLYPSLVSTYTLCDHSPRADILPVTKTLTKSTTLTATYTYIARESELPDYTVPQPCEPDARTCRMWYFHSDIVDVNGDELLAQCGNPTSTNETCVIQGGPVQLVYWPAVSKADLCENNGTVFPLSAVGQGQNKTAPKVPETITTLGHTFTSGTVYLSFSTLYAEYDGFWDRVGPTYSNLIVPLPSSAISTQCGGQRSARGSGTALDYADLNWPVPASAYDCQARCDPIGMPICPGCSFTAVPTSGACGTIWSDINPNLAVPTQIREMVPEWSTCELWNNRIPNFYFDPPIPLQVQTAMAGVTTAVAEPTAEPAAPSSTATSVVPLETGGAGPSRKSSSALDQPIIPSAGPAAVSTVSAIGIADPTTRPTAAAESSLSDWGTASTATNSPETFSVVPEAQSSSVGVLSDAPVVPSTMTSLSATITTPQNVPSEVVSALPVSDGTSHDAENQQITASLNALSVLESALSTYESVSHSGLASAISGSTDPPVTQTTATSADHRSRSIGGGQDVGGVQQPGLISSTIATSTGYTADGVTLSAGGPGVTVSNQVISAQSDGIIVAGPAPTATHTSGSGVHEPAQSGHAMANPTMTTTNALLPSPSMLAVGSLSITASVVSNSPDAIVVGSLILSHGGPAATISGETLTQGPSGLYLLGSGSSQLFTTPSLPIIVVSPTAHPITMAAAGLTVVVTPISSQPDAFAIADTTLYPGSAAITISGQIVSAGSAGLVLLGPAPAISSTTSQAVLAAGSLTVTAVYASGSRQVVSVDGTLLSAGGAALTLGGGEVVSAGSSGLVVVQSNSTIAFTSAMSSSTSEVAYVPTLGPTRGAAPPVQLPSSTETASSGGTRMGAGKRHALQICSTVLCAALVVVISLSMA